MFDGAVWVEVWEWGSPVPEGDEGGGAAEASEVVKLVVSVAEPEMGSSAKGSRLGHLELQSGRGLAGQKTIAELAKMQLEAALL